MFKTKIWQIIECLWWVFGKTWPCYSSQRYLIICPSCRTLTDTVKLLGFYQTKDGFWPDFTVIKHGYAQELYWFINKYLRTSKFCDVCFDAFVMNFVETVWYECVTAGPDCIIGSISLTSSLSRDSISTNPQHPVLIWVHFVADQEDIAAQEVKGWRLLCQFTTFCYLPS